MSRLTGHACVAADQCFDCEGKLTGSDGSYFEYYYDDGSKSFAAPVCAYCKRIRILEERHVITKPEVIDLLKKAGLPTEANYPVAMWVKVRIDQEEKLITERRYCVNLNGTISTRKDVMNLRRSLQSLRTDGWEEYVLRKTRIKGPKHAIRVLSEALGPQDYQRMF